MLVASINKDVDVRIDFNVTNIEWGKSKRIKVQQKIRKRLTSLANDTTIKALKIVMEEFDKA
jgi:hypothetical protein